ncbi:hypothetical protein [Spirillospora sp. NPDC047279]|uniref:hypothetical protein n=1 Tax=Spirillospora sp. NPDC047279 TaxID=3155478 RepID=UPI0033EE8887
MKIFCSEVPEDMIAIQRSRRMAVKVFLRNHLKRAARLSGRPLIVVTAVPIAPTVAWALIEHPEMAAPVSAITTLYIAMVNTRMWLGGARDENSETSETDDRSFSRHGSIRDPRTRARE